jgi:hypothetical protein
MSLSVAIATRASAEQYRSCSFGKEFFKCEMLGWEIPRAQHSIDELGPARDEVKSEAFKDNLTI